MARRVRFASPRQTVRGVSGQAEASRRVLASLLIAWAALVLVAVVRSGGKLSKGQRLSEGQKRGVAVAMVVAVLLLALIGEVAPGFAVGFAGLLVVATLLAGADVLGFLTRTLPTNLINAAARTAPAKPAASATSTPGSTGGGFG